MIVIRCPHCNELRSEEELTYGGEADVTRPLDPEAVTNDQWTDYLFMRDNPKGEIVEQWCCAAGCGQWFKAERDTVTHQIGNVTRFENAAVPEEVAR
ncbi:MAG TPA: sarcosine oxidase subunit delta [Trinickia sp.]|uniref:sarcosine oxidase subunit delta n=1 Tax=Trinickia sp. TaxID=2571163 RepID=UPI002F409BC2